jgi:cytochrome c oxidase assembly protein subunit 15
LSSNDSAPFFSLSLSQHHAAEGAIDGCDSAAAPAEVPDAAKLEWNRSKALANFAKIVVFTTFLLMSLGGFVTSYEAGMAVPDWPLSFGSLNPEGWWKDLHISLEHGHRLLAMFVGVLTGVLCAWIWNNWRALGVAVLVSAVLPYAARVSGVPREIVMHLAIWPAAIAFASMLLWDRRRDLAPRPALTRWLAFAAFVAVCIQATFGGLRVTRETAGAFDHAMVLRITHGTFAQIFFCLLVAIAAVLSARWTIPAWRSFTGGKFLRNLAWIAVGAILLQLVLGATMRHQGAGLAIPIFPKAAADGSFLPVFNDARVTVNFAHTRIGAILVSLLLLGLGISALRRVGSEPRLTRPAWTLIALVLIQFSLGVFVIWHQKPRTLTTLHVVNGAALLGTTLLLAMRASRAVALAESSQSTARRATLHTS